MQSLNNQSRQPLRGNTIYIGSWDDILRYQNIQVNLYTDSNCEITYYKSNNKINVETETFNYTSGSYYFNNIDSSSRYVYFTVRNTQSNVNQTKFDFNVLYNTFPITDIQNVNITNSYLDVSNNALSSMTFDSSNQLKVYVGNPSAIPVSEPALDNCISSNMLNINITGQSQNPLMVKEKPTYSVSLDAVGKTSQVIRNSAGCLHSISISQVGGSGFAYIKLYNASSAVAGDIPMCCLSLHKDTSYFVECGNMNFSGGLCVRGTDAFDNANNISPSGVVNLTCFLTGYSE